MGTESTFSKFINNRPQRLCIKCGKCCKAVAVDKTPAELLKLAVTDKDTRDFIEIFQPYTSLAAAKKAAPELVDFTTKGKNEDEIKKITFYKCKHLAPNNLCKIYQKRPDFCKDFPQTPWTKLPPGCGFEGWQFEKREEEKQIVRKYKEELLTLQAEIAKDSSNTSTAQTRIDELKNLIEQYAQFGSDAW